MRYNPKLAEIVNREVELENRMKISKAAANELVQEMNREANTIGSKCNDVQIAHLVVGIKEELEKIREQLQNIE